MKKDFDPKEKYTGYVNVVDNLDDPMVLKEAMDITKELMEQEVPEEFRNKVKFHKSGYQLPEGNCLCIFNPYPKIIWSYTP